MTERGFTLRAYGWLTRLAQPLVRRKLRRRARAEPGYAEAVEERFGRYGPQSQSQPQGGWYWIHAVSLGEARAAGILIEALRRAVPGLRLLLTHGTATGRAEGARWLRAGDVQVWQPWDEPGAVARFLEHFRPRIGVLMETEVWPVLTAACATRGIPLVLANARLNARSLAAAERIGWLARPTYAALAAVWAQSSADAERLAALGARVEGVFGNLKFDAAPDAAQLARGRAWRAALGRPVVLLASSRDGEERGLLDVLKRFRAAACAATGLDAMNVIAKEDTDAGASASAGASAETDTGAGAGTAGGAAAAAAAAVAASVQWLIVPRHPQRFDAVAALIEAEGFTLARRSAAREGEGALSPADVWLGDSLGEMALYYGLADVALLGGSFEPLGGQNLIEAAACGCPVVMGASTFNFAEAAELALAAGAARRTDSLEEGVRAALALLAEPARRHAMADAALRFAASHRGAAERTAAAVLAWASARAPDRTTP